MRTTSNKVYYKRFNTASGNPKNKYRNEIVYCNGIKFHSKAERDYYLILVDKKQRNEIKEFRRQPKYLLQEGYIYFGKKRQPINYIADFEVVNNDGSIDVIDVKGVKTKEFSLKQKMFEYKYQTSRLILIDTNMNIME